MALKFVDREGVEIEEHQWYVLFSNSTYRVLLVHKERNLCLDVTWVGVWLTSYEQRARPFCVDVAREGETRAITGKLPPTRFYATEEEALDAFERLKEELFGPLPRKRA